MHILKQNDYYKRKVLIIAVCISLHVVEIQLEAASSFTSGYVGDLFILLMHILCILIYILIMHMSII